MHEPIVRLVTGMVAILPRPLTVGRHNPGQASNVAYGPRAVRASRAERSWPLDVETGRLRRWGRRGLVPPAGEWRPLLRAEGTYFPPEPWEELGTLVRPRVMALAMSTGSRAAGRGAAL
jgi:hypothetical protein